MHHSKKNKILNNIQDYLKQIQKLAAGQPNLMPEGLLVNLLKGYCESGRGFFGKRHHTVFAKKLIKSLESNNQDDFYLPAALNEYLRSKKLNQTGNFFGLLVAY